MTHDEALAIVRCALGEDAPVKTEVRWFDRLDTNGIELGPQAFTVQQGESKPCDYQRNWPGCGFGSREWTHVDEVVDRQSTGLNSSHQCAYRMPASDCKKKKQD